MKAVIKTDKANKKAGKLQEKRKSQLKMRSKEKCEKSKKCRF